MIYVPIEAVSFRGPSPLLSMGFSSCNYPTSLSCIINIEFPIIFHYPPSHSLLAHFPSPLPISLPILPPSSFFLFPLLTNGNVSFRNSVFYHKLETHIRWKNKTRAPSCDWANGDRPTRTPTATPLPHPPTHKNSHNSIAPKNASKIL